LTNISFLGASSFASYRERKEKGETSRIPLAGSPQNLFLELASILNFCLR
jgi:hypothetical protein